MESWRFRTSEGDVDVGQPALLRAQKGQRLGSSDPRLRAVMREISGEPSDLAHLRRLVADRDGTGDAADLDGWPLCQRALRLVDAGVLDAVLTRVRAASGGGQARAAAAGAAEKPAPAPAAADEPTVFALDWSKRQVPVGEQVFAEFTPRDCKGGEKVTLVFYEVDRDARTELERQQHTLASAKDRAKIAWKRSEEQAEADRLDDGVPDELLEYRFEVLMNDESAGESGPLHLTTDVTWKPKDKDGDPVGDGYVVECDRADGKKERAPIKDGAAAFEAVPLGTTTFTVVPRVIERLAWSKTRVPAATEVAILFAADGFLGGEKLKVEISECDADGGRDSIETIEADLPKGSGDFALEWKRGEAAAQQDLLNDLDQGDRVVEYRFTVEIGGTKAAAESPPLHLTFSAVIEPKGSDGAPLEDGAVVACIEGDGHVALATVEGGQAVFRDLLLGHVEFVTLTPRRA